MMVRMDDRTWVHITRNLDAKAAGLMNAADFGRRQVITSTNIGLDGKTSTYVFEKQ
jgi:hypothetical protein